MRILGFAEQARRNRIAAIARTIPTSVGVFVVTATGVVVGGSTFERLVALIAGSALVPTLHRLWWLGLAPLFGLRVVAVKRGMGRPREADVRKGRLRVRGAMSLGSGVDLAPRAESTSRLRVWLGFVAELAVLAAVMVALTVALPGTWGIGLALGALFNAVQMFAPYPASATPGWFLFVMPFAGPERFAGLLRSDAEVRVGHLLALGNTAEAREALGLLDAESPAALRYAAELAVMEGRYPEAGQIALSALPALRAGADRAVLAQTAVRAFCYAHEGGAPAGLPPWMDGAASVGLTLMPAHPTSDAAALYLLLSGQPAAAAREADRAALHTRSKPDAAHALCTAAMAHTAAGKPQPAKRALQHATELWPGLPRLAFTRLVVLGPGAVAPDGSGSESTTPDGYHAQNATEEDAWKW